jgi:hypothetical protein
MMNRRSVMPWAAITLLAAAGCQGNDRAKVSGKLLRQDGTPLAGARVIATSGSAGKSAYGTTDQQGKFELGVAQEGDGVPPGKYEVTIVEDRGDPDNRRPASIAAKYRDPATSGLTLDVQAGETAELNLTLEPPE